MDNLSVHRGKWVRDLGEEKGCQLWQLPSYSPDLNPIEEAISKVKNLIRKAKVRALQALFAVTARALEAISSEDTRGFFEDCGYGTLRGHSL
jgi:transposase